MPSQWGEGFPTRLGRRPATRCMPIPSSWASSRWGPRAARAAAPARGPALDGAGMGDAPLPAPDGSGALVVAARPAKPRDGHRDERQRQPTHRADSRSVRWASSPARPLTPSVSSPIGWTLTYDHKKCPGAFPSTRTISTRTTTPTGQRLFGRSLPGRARARRVPGSLSGTFDTRECVVGIVRSRRQPLFRTPGCSTFE